jgi:hypothetical protein
MSVNPSRGYLIYHPAREQRDFNGIRVYFDRTVGNQDPYVWNNQFLHTYCHITELRQPAPGDVNFWVSGNCFPNFTKLFCDLIFVVDQRCDWQNPNSIAATDPIVDNPNAFNDHYQWAGRQHPFKKRGRFTLKGCAKMSFQPQTNAGQLIDIVPFLGRMGITLPALQAGLRKSFVSKPMLLTGATAQALYTSIANTAGVRLLGKQLQGIRAANPTLSSRQQSPRRGHALCH